MKLTLLEITQEILSSMDSDEVNSISDTPEATQVALIVRRAYLDLAARLNLPEHFDFFKLTASGDNNFPTIMYRPDTVSQLVWLKYDKRLESGDPADYQDVKYLEPSTFFDRMFSLNTDDTDVDSGNFVVGSDGFTLMWRNNVAPSYWTSMNDSTLVFDAYDSSMDTTLQKAKTHCWGLLNTSFTLTDGYTPDLDSQQFSLLVNDAKALAWAELKQATHQRAERESKRQLVSAQRNKQALPGNYPDLSKLPNYGRR